MSNRFDNTRIRFSASFKFCRLLRLSNSFSVIAGALYAQYVSDVILNVFVCLCRPSCVCVCVCCLSIGIGIGTHFTSCSSCFSQNYLIQIVHKSNVSVYCFDQFECICISSIKIAIKIDKNRYASIGLAQRCCCVQWAFVSVVSEELQCFVIYSSV